MKTVEEIKKLTAGSKNIIEVAKRLADFHIEDDDELVEAAYELQGVAEKLAAISGQVARKAKEVSDRVSHQVPEWNEPENLFGPFYSGVNSLGELQGSAMAFDIACALYAKAHDEFNAVIRRRARLEREAARKVQRAQYTGRPALLLTRLERDLGGRATFRQLVNALDWEDTEVRTAVDVLAEQPEPFLIRVYNSKKELKEVIYQAEVRG